MVDPTDPTAERRRVAALHSLRILDTGPEERFDRVTRLAQQYFRVPIAAISLVDTNRHWFKSVAGLDSQETTREQSFCTHAVESGECLVVPDASNDPRFADLQLVTGAEHLRFYAGEPLKDAAGNALGTLCIMDREPRSLDKDDEEMLTTLARLAERELVNLTQAERFQALIADSPDGIVVVGADRQVHFQSPGFARMLAYTDEEQVGSDAFLRVHPDDLPAVVKQ